MASSSGLSRNEGAGKNDESLCGTCSSKVDVGISCEGCETWFHLTLKCSGIKKSKSDPDDILNSPRISYHCKNCKPISKADLTMMRNELKGEMDQMKTQLQLVLDQLHCMQQSQNQTGKDVKNDLEQINRKLDSGGVNSAVGGVNPVVGGKKTFADTLKTKNVLIVKSTQENEKAADSMKMIMSDISTPVEKVKPTKDGHLIVNFASKNDLEEAKKELEDNKDQHKVSVTMKNKMKPKIKIVNVSKDDDNIIESIKMKAPWLSSMIEEEDDFKLVKEMEARGQGLKHCIIRCTPMIRKKIFERGDKLATLYESCRVYDSYLVYQCYKCQGFGHSATKCNNTQVCVKCSGNHMLKDCNENSVKCINCTNQAKTDTKHKASSSECPLYQEELSRVKNITDHGFE